MIAIPTNAKMKDSLEPWCSVIACENSCRPTEHMIPAVRKRSQYNASKGGWGGGTSDCEESSVRRVVKRKILSVDTQPGCKCTRGLRQTAQKTGPDDRFRARLQGEKQRERHGKSLGDVVDEQSDKHVEPQSGICVVGSIRDDALNSLDSS